MEAHDALASHLRRSVIHTSDAKHYAARLAETRKNKH
jgi:hypothetical protein